MIFPGPMADMPAALAAADLILAPSNKAESFGRVVVEAQAMGRPVIASAMGAHVETVVHGVTGWLAPPGDVAAWTRAIDAALASPPAISAAMAHAGREQAVTLYSLSTMVAGTFEVYRRLLDEAR